MASVLPASDSPTSIRRRKLRQIKDRLAKQMIGIGGISVIIAIVLIFFYLLYVVFPLFMPGGMERITEYSTPKDGQKTLYLAMEEQNEVAVRFDDGANATFLNTVDGSVRDRVSIELPLGASVSSFAAATPATRIVAYGLDDGQVVVAKHEYKISYPNDKRLITPVIEYPFGTDPIEIDSMGNMLTLLAVQRNADQASIVGMTDDRRILITTLTLEESMFDDEVSIEASTATLDGAPTNVSHLLLDKEQRTLYIAEKTGHISAYNVSDPSDPELIQRLSVVAPGEQITDIKFLTGDISLLIATNKGEVSQWFPVRDENNNKILTRIRHFDASGQQVNNILPEYFRKGFVTTSDQGQLSIHHATANQTVIREQISNVTINHMAISPRASALLAEDANQQLLFWKIDNEHPEVSWESLWGKVWYESYQEPDYIWQSSSASNDFEPKFSLTPISFGTIKAAFYAMLFAVPLAIMGAIYTAYFMTPKMRSTVKPSIEIMEALPTVILGFLAGLWLAPFVEEYLAGIFTLLLLLPLSILICSYFWYLLPRELRGRVPEGWQSLMLVLPIILTAWLSFALSSPIEHLFFDGSLRSWMDRELGIGYDQRNSLVVGLAMGFAVIPTIFSITEDAIFSVPKHLTTGSLALGATQWQTLMRVVLLTASPGIFSAVMIGLGRAVGETMIVLMATGNTPLMDMSIFQGMRTLSANIAVEMPESEVASTHYRILFLAALVLFMFTFFFNTIAEVVRQRLRRKYSSL